MRLEPIRIWLASRAHQGLCLVALFLLSVASIAPIDRKGDASEYILATESLCFDHDLVVGEGDLRRNAMLRSEGLLDIPSGLDSISGTDGKRRYGLHSFYYSLFVVPFYALLSYRGFFVFNAIGVLVFIAAVYARFERSEGEWRAFAFSVGGVFLSALWSYVFFTMTETFYASLLAVFFFMWHTGRPRRAALFGGIAFGAQIPLGAFAVPFVWDLARRREWKLLSGSLVVLVACAIPQLSYNLFWLGALFPMHAGGNAVFGHVEWRVLLATLVDPSMGFFWFYPVSVYCLGNAKRDTRTILVLVACGFVAIAMNTVQNIYSHQVGIRLGAYLFPAVLFLVHRLDTASLRSRLGIALTVVVGAGLAMNPLGNSMSMDLRRATFLPYRIASLVPGYHDNPEVFESSSLTLRTGQVYARDIFPDRWTFGSRARILLQGVREGRVELDLNSWGRMDHTQRVRIRLLGGRVLEAKFPPSQVATFPFDLRAEDLFEYRRLDENEFAYLDIETEPWIPEWDAPELASKDTRRIGVRLLAIRWRGRELLARP